MADTEVRKGGYGRTLLVNGKHNIAPIGDGCSAAIWGWVKTLYPW